jgi:hypothetical protein
MKQLLALTMIALLVPTAAAMAKGACKDDKEKFCKDVIAGGGKPGPCLKEHINELSPACKEKLSKPKEARAQDEKADDKPADAKTEAPAAGTAPSGAEATGGTDGAGGSTSKE